MEYIINPQTGGIDFTPYSAHVESIRKLLPPHVYAFAADSRHYDLQSPSSLHDAWLESFTVREAANGKRTEIRQVEIVLVLLGMYHDRRIQLHYTGVTHYSFENSANQGGLANGHGDLFTHEVRLGGEGRLVHEILFERATSLLIECSDFEHSEEMLANARQTGDSTDQD